MRYMRWSYADLAHAPQEIVDTIFEIMSEDGGGSMADDIDLREAFGLDG